MTSGGEIVVDESESSAEEVTNPELASALSLLCDFARDEMADRSNPSEARLQRVESRFQATPQEDLLDRFFDAVERHAVADGESRFPTFHAVQAAADANGVPGYQCEPFEQLLDLVHVGDPDVDLTQMRTPLQELGLICDVAREAETWEVDDAERSYQLARRLNAELSNPEVRRLFGTVGNAPAEQRYEMFQMGAGELGAVGWTCPALGRVLAPAD